MSTLKILYIVRQAEFGGGETHIKYIIDYLNTNEFIPILVSLKEGYLSDYFKTLGFKFYLLSNKKIGLIYNFIKLIWIIKKEKIKFIHSHGTKGAAIILLPAILTNKKLIYTVHSWSFHSKLNKVQIILRRFIEALICSYAYQVIFVSESDYKLGDFVPSGKKILIKNGVDVSRFSPIRDKLFRIKNGYNEDDFVIGFFSRFTNQKNPNFVIQLIKSLSSEEYKSKKKFKLLMIGDGELKDEIINEIEKNKLFDIVKVLPPSFEIEKYLHIIDCYILPSYWEGLPYGILEAMSCGVPVIASVHSNIYEIANCHEDSFCENLDLEAFKKRVIQLANDLSLYQKISQKARKTIEEKFKLEESLSQLFKVYEKLKVEIK